MMRTFWMPVGLACLLVTASGCGSSEDGESRPLLGKRSSSSTPEALPAPEAAGGSVTGLSGAGVPGQAGIVLGTAPDELENAEEAPASDDIPLPVAEDAPASDGSLSALATVESRGARQLSSEAAVQVARSYFSRINAGDAVGANGLWGAAPNWTPAPDVVGISAQLGQPTVSVHGNHRLVDVPLTLQQSLADGQVRMASGVMTLQAPLAAASDARWVIVGVQMR